MGQWGKSQHQNRKTSPNERDLLFPDSKTFSIELSSKVDKKAKKQDSLLSLTQQRLDFYKPLIHLEESPNCQTLKSSSQPLLPTMGNNLLAVNEPKRNRHKISREEN